MSRFFITGVTSFIGARLAAALSQHGDEVSGTTAGHGAPIDMPYVKRTIVWRLGDPVDALIAEPVDGVIHCAWDLRPGCSRANVDGTRRLADAFERAGAAHQLFISSYSAHPAAVTEYAASKLAVQRFMLERHHGVARLGIAIGPGGIYRRMREALTQHRIVPMIGGGTDRVPIVAIHDLTQALTAIVERRLTGAYNLFNPELVPLREVLLETRAASGSRAALVSVPFALVVPPLWLARRLGVALPLDIDNVRAMRANQTVNDQSDLRAFVAKPMTLPEMVRAAAGA